MADIGASGNYNDALRVRYPQVKVDLLAYRGCPGLAMVPKRTNFTGKQEDIVCWFGTPQGVGSTFAGAGTNKTHVLVDAFNLTHAKRYGRVSWQGLTLAQAQGDGKSLDVLMAGTEGLIFSVTHALCSDLYGNGGGSLGVVGSVSTTSLTLSNVEHIVNFAAQMELQASATDGTSGAVRSGTATITGINNDTAVLTSDSNWTAQITSITTGDYLFRNSDFGSVIKGFRAWVPDSAPGATAFFGVDRTQDVTKLGGIRYDGSPKGTHEEALQGALARMAREGAFSRGGKITVFVCQKDYTDLSQSLGSKATYEKMNVRVSGPNAKGKRVSAVIGFDSIKLNDFGNVNVVPDRYVPQGRALALMLDSWSLRGAGAMPHILMRDGVKMLRETDDDAYELRVGYYGNLGCHAPGYNANILLPT